MTSLLDEFMGDIFILCNALRCSLKLKERVLEPAMVVHACGPSYREAEARARELESSLSNLASETTKKKENPLLRIFTM